MANKYVSINEAAELVDKSVQTIRRAIKAKKLKTRKVKTPQGFHYLVKKDSLAEAYDMSFEEKAEQTEQKAEVKAEAPKEVKAETKEEVKNELKTEEIGEEGVHISAKDFREFTKTLQGMVAQHSKERQNFMRLINTLQEKVFVMENQLNLLKMPQKKWYQVWK